MLVRKRNEVAKSCDLYGHAATVSNTLISRIGPHLHQHVDREIAADAGQRRKKAVDRRPSIVDVRDHVGFPDRVVRVVVRQVAFALQLRECLPEILHLFRKRW